MIEFDPAGLNPLLLRHLGEEGCRRLLARAEETLRTGAEPTGGMTLEEVHAMINERLRASEQAPNP